MKTLKSVSEMVETICENAAQTVNGKIIFDNEGCFFFMFGDEYPSYYCKVKKNYEKFHPYYGDVSMEEFIETLIKNKKSFFINSRGERQFCFTGIEVPGYPELYKRYQNRRIGTFR